MLLAWVGPTRLENLFQARSLEETTANYWLKIGNQLLLTPVCTLQLLLSEKYSQRSTLETRRRRLADQSERQAQNRARMTPNEAARQRNREEQA